MRRIGILLGILLLFTVTSIAFAQGVSREERAEIRFLEGMIDHHQMALDMAEHCLEVADTEALSDICQAVIDAQTPEIEQMQAWLLEWYNIAYTPTSMLHQDHEPEPTTPTDAGPSGMMGMMGGMSDMMSQMSNMMGMMGGSGMMDGMGMMQGGGSQGSMMQGEMMGMMQNMSEMMTHMLNMMEMTGGSGMMSEMGMMQSGMSQGGQPEMGAMADMSIEHSLHLMALLQGLTIGDLLERAADSGEDTALMDVLDTLMSAGEFAPDMGMMLPRMGNMTHGQMMNMLGEMGNLSLADVREMAGHLDEGDDAALLSMMEHHMEVMAGGAEESTDHSAHQGAAAVEATEEAAGSPTDHAAHHPETTSEATGAAVDHSAHQGVGSGPFTDMTMTMGMMAGFDRLTGSDYVVAWLESMIDHHGDAIHMAERLLPRVVHPELGELAQRIIADQSVEIDQMEALIAVLANAG